MDTSLEYIEMCLKAEEIQKHSLDIGDLYYRLPSREVKLVRWGDQKRLSFIELKQYGKAKIEQRVGTVWLPRQDQLQEMMVSEETEPAFIIIDKLACFAMWVKYQCHEAYTSMEQLWLVFVMKEKFGKVWDGKEWNLEKTA